VFPYLLRGLNIDHANQVWCEDITYIPMRKGFVCLVAIMDWHSRKMLGWRLSNTLDAGIQISMDGKGRWVDNAFIERLWCSLKYAEVYLHAYDSIPRVRDGIRRWMHFYNHRRKHQALEKRTPYTLYYENLNAEARASA
jgi:putative transposase